MLAFVKSALLEEEEDPWRFFDGWEKDEWAKELDGRKGKGRAVGRQETATDMMEQGYLVNLGAWSTRPEHQGEWEVRKASSAHVREGENAPVLEVLSVSLLVKSSFELTTPSSNYIYSSIPFYCRLSSSPLLPLSPLHLLLYSHKPYRVHQATWSCLFAP